MTGWQPIETAPRDKIILIWTGREVRMGYLLSHAHGPGGDWTSHGAFIDTPTHWMPLPPPPTPEPPRA